MNVMRQLLFMCVVICTFFSCKTINKQSLPSFKEVVIETILKDSLLNVRALEIYNAEVFIATSTGETMKKSANSNEFTTLFKPDTIHNPNFRALACTSKSVFTISIANPGLLYKDGRLVYKEEHENVFLRFN